MINDKIMDIIIATIPVIGVVLTGILIPFVKANLTEKQLKKAWDWAEIAAVAIEKHYEGKIGKGKIKKEYVMSFLIDNLKFDKFMTEGQLNLIVDAVVEQIINKDKVKVEIEGRE